MAMIQQDARRDPRARAYAAERAGRAKWDIGYVSDDMSLFGGATLAWHMGFVKSIYAGWDEAYAKTLLKRFNLRPEQQVKGLSHGERTKAALLLVLARRPRLLILDEPTSGLDPVARHEALAEFMEVLKDDDRSILFSSHNTLDVEQISDQITFIDRGRIVDSNDKEVFLDRWRRISLDVRRERRGCTSRRASRKSRARGHTAVVTTNAYSPALQARVRAGRRRRARRATHDARRDLRRHRHAQPQGARRMSNSIVWRLIREGFVPLSLADRRRARRRAGIAGHRAASTR